MCKLIVVVLSFGLLVTGSVYGLESTATPKGIAPFIAHFWLQNDNILSTIHGPDGTGMVINSRDGKQILPRTSIKEASVSPTGKFIAVVYPSGDLKIIDSVGKEVVSCDSGNIGKVDWSLNERHIAYNVTESDNSVTLMVFDIQANSKGAIHKESSQHNTVKNNSTK